MKNIKIEFSNERVGSGTYNPGLQHSADDRSGNHRPKNPIYTLHNHIIHTHKH